MAINLTEIGRRILDFMVLYLRTNTYQPSIREIGERFAIKSTKTVSEHLQALAESRPQPVPQFLNFANGHLCLPSALGCLMLRKSSDA